MARLPRCEVPSRSGTWPVISLQEMYDSILGHYANEVVQVSVVSHRGELLLRLPGTPSGYEPRLVPTDGSWSISGGDYEGVEVTFSEDALIVGGFLTLNRVEEVPETHPGSGLLAPAYESDPRYESLWAETEQGGGPIQLPVDMPVGGFVRWLGDRDEVIFHGSNRSDIDVFQPRRESTELHDPSGRGNLAAVYGTHDGLWAMFFAVVDRRRMKGSIRSGVERLTNRAGEVMDAYRFSVSSESEATWCNGTLYILPRDRFKRLEMFPGGPRSAEWACVGEVSPLARVLVSPADFPFLDDVGVHDDTKLIHLEGLRKEIREAIVGFEDFPGGLRMHVHLSPSKVEQWKRLVTEFYPQVTIRAESNLGVQDVEILGPPAVLQSYQPAKNRDTDL